jgi:hypothetical protein
LVGLSIRKPNYDFNNGNGRTGGNYSTIEIKATIERVQLYANITLYQLVKYQEWCTIKSKQYAQNISAQQLSNGNVFL